MWDAIRSNQRKSMALIILMGVLLVLLGFVIGMSVDPQIGGAYGAIAAVGIWMVMCFVALTGGDQILLMSSNAHQIEKRDAPQLYNIVEEMTIAAGLPKMPAVYIVDDHIPNAFAVGRKPEKAAVAVTTGLLKRLNRDELQGVVGHEIGHIRNLDVRFMTIASGMLGSIILISDIFVRSVFYGGRVRSSRSSRSRDSGGGQLQAILLIVALLMAILAPICARLLYLACSRRREYLADASSARLTRYPEGLASALEKISGRMLGALKVSRALAPLYIVNPLQGRSVFSLFSTHPPTEKRIQILRSMAGGAGFLDYEKAYAKVWGERKRCIGAETLQSEGERIPIRAPIADIGNRQDAVKQAQEVGDLLGRILNFLLIPCACGVRIKIPPEFNRPEIVCPRCGRKHPLSEAQKLTELTDSPTGDPVVFQGQRTGWKSVQCSCGKNIQISPKFSGNSIRCSQCGQEIQVISK